jgi:cyclophilin family peptidyl-prolyl cis-trans isomerase/HEAT repeat protein
MTVEEEARILRLEDRREYDPAIVAEWVHHPNALHRARIAMALGRIGPHTVLDANHDGERAATDRPAGLADLISMTSDPDRGVRENVALALGEIGDRSAADALFGLTSDPDAGVAGEAIEALSKLSGDVNFVRDRLSRYLWLTSENWPEGLRARAIRFLFRFERDEASEVALKALSSSSSAVRQEAAYTFSRRPYPKASRQLELMMTDPNVLTRAYATVALGRIGDPAAAPLLLAALNDAHPWVRTNAAVALGRVAEKTPAILRTEDLPKIFAALEDPDPGVRANTIDLLGYYAAVNESARKRLLDTAENGTQWERDLAASAFGKRIYVHAEAQLRAAGSNVTPDAVFAQSVTSFNKLMPHLSPWGQARLREAIAPITTIAYPAFIESKDPVLRAAGISSLPEFTATQELARIRAALTDPDVIVRAAAIEKYAKSTDESPQVWLTALMDAEQRERTAEMNDARLAAITAIADYERPQRGPFLRSLLTDADPVVRRVASDLIVSKLSGPRMQYTPLPVERPQAEYEEIVRWSRQPHTATIHMGRGKIELALLTQEAPMTAWNFAQLAKKKFFDNTSFMRVVPNFVIQGGDPRNDTNGGPGYAIRDEINLQKYTRGAVGMALSGPDTGGSQFFITHSPQPHLDGGYTIFGRVYSGMSGVVDQTERGDRVETITIDEHPPVSAEQVTNTQP